MGSAGRQVPAGRGGRAWWFSGWRWLDKPLLFLACLLPLGWLAYRMTLGDPGANPLETVKHETGIWCLRLLLLTLLVSPLRRFTGWTGWLRYRRMLGLFAFFYGLLHFAVWVWLDHGLLLSAILADIVKRPYVTVGFASLLLMLPLALTSTRAQMRRLGRRWKQLHRLIYPAGVLGVVHFVWLVKADLREPLIYAGILLLLLLLRLPAWRRPRTA